jgi:hypothetical protein
MIARLRIDQRAARVRLLGFVCLLALGTGGWRPIGLSAQGMGSPGSTDEVRRQIARRFDVLPITNGILLTPKTPISGVRSIELTGGTISIDGAPVTGAELLSRLGADGDAVLKLSYLDPATQRAFAAAGGRAAPPESPASPQSPPSPRAPDFSPGSGSSSSPGPRGRTPLFGGPRVRLRGDDRVVIGPRGVTVAEGEVVYGNAVAVGGHLLVLGEVQGDAVSIGGGVELGPRAIVGRNVVTIGGELQRDPGAQIGGEVQDVGWGGGQFDDWWRRAWSGVAPAGPIFSATFALCVTMARVALICLLSGLILLLGREYVERISARAAAEPLKAGLIGLFSQILFLPLLIAATIVLVVTIIGIPLLLLMPFLILGFCVVALIGFTGVAHHVGRLFAAKAGWTLGPYAATLVGILAIVSPLLLARFAALLLPTTFGFGLIGLLVEYLAWTVGFGAVALTRFSKVSV